MNLFRIAVSRPVATVMAFLAIMVFGIFSYIRLPIDLFPEIEPPYITVITTYQGAGALEVEQNVTDHLEQALSTVPNLLEITSTSVDNLSTITLEFEYGISLDEAANDVRDVIGRVSSILPDDVDDPIIYKFSSSSMPVVIFSATAEQSYNDLERILEDQVVGPLNRIEGVGAVTIIGAPVPQIEVILDPQRFEAYGLSLQQVAQILAAENVIVPAGRVDLGTNSYNLRVNSEFTDPEQIANVVISNRDGRVVYLRDIADVRQGLEDEVAISRVNGNQGVALMVQKQTGANTVSVANEVNRRIPALIETLPPDVRINTIIDTSEFIVHSIDNLTRVIFYALLFVVLIVLIFLRQWRATIVIAVTIPVSLIVAFIYLALTGSSLNIISLSSLSIALGMVVDDAIVVLENIMKHVEKGSSPKQAAIYGTSEVGLAVVATTLTIVAVFLPLTFVTGMMGIWFRELGFIVSVTIVTSTIAALSLTPMMGSLMLKRPGEGKHPPKPIRALNTVIGRWLDWLDRFYGSSLRWALAHKKTILFSALGIFVLSLMQVPRIGTEFMPQSDSGQLVATMELATGRSLDYTSQVVSELEKKISEAIPEADIISSTTGSGGGMMSIGGTTNQATIRLALVELAERERSVFEIADVVRGILANMPEVETFAVTTEESMMGNVAPIAVNILGNNIEETTRLAESLAEHMRGVEGVRDVRISRGDVRPELEFVFDRERLSAFGLNSASVATVVRGKIAGLTATTFRREGDEYDVVLRYDESVRNSLSQIENIAILTPYGTTVRVKDLGTIREYMAPPNIDHIDRERSVTVSSGIMGRPLNLIIADIQKWVDAQNLPPQIEIVISGDYEDQQEAFADLFMILVLSLILVYLVMAAQFESLRDPFIIMFSVPFAFTGVVFALLMSGTKLGVISLLGAIILVGIVVKNGIVLVDYTNLMRARGLPINAAVVRSGISRLRPVLMTTLTTILAMVPMVLSKGEGSEIWRPMAVSVIGGLTFSTLVTLILVPTVYAVFESRKEKRRNKAFSGDGAATKESIPKIVPVH